MALELSTVFLLASLAMLGAGGSRHEIPAGDGSGDTAQGGLTRARRSCVGRRPRRVCLRWERTERGINRCTYSAYLRCLETRDTFKECNSMKVIEALIEEGDGRNLRACIERNPRIINETIGGVPAVHLALRKKQERMAILFLSRGASPSARDPSSDGETPLHAAAGAGMESAAILLMESEDVEVLDNSLRTPLWHAARGGHGRMIRMLVDRGADVNKADTCNMSPLYAAADKGRTSAIEALLELGADANVETEQAEKLLLRGGADPSPRRFYDPLELAAERDSLPFFLYLWRLRGATKEELGHMLFIAVAHRAGAMLEHFAQSERGDGVDWGSVLQKCCVHGFSPCVRSLLRHRRGSFQEETSEQEVLDRSLFFNFRGDLRHKDSTVLQDRIEVAVALVRGGANASAILPEVDQCPGGGNADVEDDTAEPKTALVAAAVAQRNAPILYQALLEMGVNESQMLNGVSALDYAACCGSEDLVRWKMRQQQGQKSSALVVARRAAEVAAACGAEEVLRSALESLGLIRCRGGIEEDSLDRDALSSALLLDRRGEFDFVDEFAGCKVSKSIGDLSEEERRWLRGARLQQ